MITPINELDRVEILTLQDNCIDLTTRDDTEVLKRARPVKQSGEVNSIIAEHGFSAFVTVFKGEKSRSMLFDFGFSEFGAAYNAEALEVNLTQVEALALSHGHMDHYGGLRQLARLVGRTNLEFVVHPAAFRAPRYRKVSGDVKFYAPTLSRDTVKAAGCILTETETPYPLLENSVLFLGAVPRRTGFEKGDANRFYEENGEEKIDTVEEDTAVVFNVRHKGLVVLTGCAHSGIINTVNYAREQTGQDKVFAIMGGFHLPSPFFDPVLEPTTEALKQLNPDFVAPTHCTGRKAIMHIEKEMPDKFLFNMAGTKMIFAA